MDRTRAPTAGRLHPFDFPTVRRLTISNGLPLLVAELHHHPVVTLSMLLDAGGAREEGSLAGVASLTASLLESGSAGRDAGETAEALETLGVQLETGVSWDATHIGLTTLASRVEPAMPIFADLIRRPTFPQAEVERLRTERLADIAQRHADPRSLASEAVARFIFPADSPFARPLGGTTDSVRQLTRQDIMAFHSDLYGSSGAALVVVGDVSSELAVELAERLFSDWPVATLGLASSARWNSSSSDTSQVVIVDRPGSVQSEVRVGHVGVARDTPDYFPLLVMNTLLGGAFSSRLNLNLRERHGYTYGARSLFAMRRQPGPFLVSTAVQTEVTAAAVTEIHREIRALREHGVERTELEDARSYLAGVFPLRMQTTDGIAAHLAELVVYDLPPDYWDTYRDRVLEVGADEVWRVARDHLRPDALTTLVVGDASRLRDSLEAADVGPVRVVSPDEIASS